MLTFFHSWRRKMGVLTLVVACVFMEGWVRSQSVTDIVSYSPAENALDYWFSTRNACGLLTMRVDKEKQLTLAWDEKFSIDGPSYPTWFTSQSSLLELSHLQRQLQWQSFGIGVCEYEDSFGMKEAYFAIRYWSIVVPLIMLSAYLLIVNPRVAKPVEST